MSKRSVQLNIRTEAFAAEALREEAVRRGVALGDVLSDLLTRARASTETGVWLSLPVEVESALKALAAAEGITPEQLLTQMIAGDLRTRLLQMVEGLRGPAGGRRSSGAEFLEGSGLVARGSQGAEERSRSAQEVNELGVKSPRTATNSGTEPGSTRRNPAQGLPLLGDEEDEEVGIFTVFE